MRRANAYDAEVMKARYSAAVLHTFATCVLLVCLTGCSSSKPTTSRAFSNALSPKNVKRIDAQEAPFVAGKSGLVYHTRYCRYAAAIKDPAGYSSARDASIKGLIPCEFCNPQSHVVATPPATQAKQDKQDEKKEQTDKREHGNTATRDENVTGQ